MPNDNLTGAGMMYRRALQVIAEIDVVPADKNTATAVHNTIDCTQNIAVFWLTRRTGN
jgi:hypothetical protein